MTIRRDGVHLALLTLAVTLACAPILFVGLQDGSSHAFNLSWAAGFSEQLLGGVFYPRWLPDQNSGAGSPVFYFYGAVPYYFSGLVSFFCSSCSSSRQLGVGMWVVILCSGLTFYALARQSAGPKASLMGSILYALAPYHFPLNLLHRQALGETTAYIWIPLVFLFMNRVIRGRGALVGLAVSYGCLIMTHLPTALIVSGFGAIYAVLATPSFERLRTVGRLTSAVSLGLLLSGGYLIPALSTQQYISAHELWTPALTYHNWFFLDGVAAPDPPWETKLTKLMAVYTIVFIPTWAVAYRSAERRHRIVPALWLLLFAGAWFLMTPVSWPVWEIFPPLQKIQFPWRVIVIMDLAVASTFVLAFQRLKGWQAARVCCAIASGVLLVTSTYLAAERYLAHWALVDDKKYRAELESKINAGLDPPEYLPSTVQLPRRDALERIGALDRVKLDPGVGSVRVKRWEARQIVAHVRLDEAAEVTFRQFYYPGWSASLTGARIRVAPSTPEGLITLVAPPGKYELTLELHQVWQETAGWISTGVAVAILLIVGLAERRSRVRSSIPIREC